MTQTQAFSEFLRGIAERRAALLKDASTNKLFYPNLGTEWSPNRSEIARCDAFILFFVAELEHYFEWIIERSIESYKETYSAYFLKHSKAGSDYLEKISAKLRDVAKNNNANWSKISPHFEFIGMGKESHFPPNYWDDIDSIVTHRGHIAHKGAGIRVSEDRREIFRKIAVTIKRTRYFDEHFSGWLASVRAEHVRVTNLSLSFSPPRITIN